MASSIWPKSSKARVDRSLSAHSVMGLAISAVMFIICLSGTVAVFEDEIGWWENPASAAVETVSPATAQTTARNVIAAQPGTTHLYLYLPRENWPRYVAGGDDGLQTVTPGGELSGEYETPWNDFLIDLHYYLNLPASFGMIVVATFGVMLIAMAISGFLAHPRIFRDAFRFRRKGQARLIQADLHNRLSVWTAPFTIVVAGTGAMIGLFAVVALVLAQTSFDGDTRALSEAIFGEEPAMDETPTRLAEVDAALLNLSVVAPDADPFLVIVHDPGTAGQHVSIYGEHHDRLVYGEMYNFDAAGNYTGHTGFSDGELGQQIAMSTYRVHFGDFGGLPVKLAYFVFGIALCIIIAAGMNIYFLKRREAGRPMPGFEAAWSALVWGTPALLTLALLAALVGLPAVFLGWLFWAGLVAASAACAVRGNAIQSGALMRIILAVALSLSVIIHAARFIPSYTNPYIWITSAGLLGLGVCVLSIKGGAISVRAPRQALRPAD
ncbi:MAG: PepSY-associated TM helix domain-containing protein [Henriciella sp.]|uniref:PepSY-associated TM helix domain-containing protein n=1 Tax=Henriciella sp. TaxID=1968823 RepID=UPI003C78E949